MEVEALPPPVRLKLDLMFSGVRYSDALGAAVEHAFPNFYPYRFQPGEPDPTGRGHARIPYLMHTDDGTMVRIKGNGASPWVVTGDRDAGYRLRHDTDGTDIAIDFEPLPAWMEAETSDGFPMAQAGVSLHGDMAVVNVAPGCQYFLAEKSDGRSMRCAFCTYGAPDARTRALGQDMNGVPLPSITYRRMQEVLAAALDEGGIGTVYVVGGSMTDWSQEGERYLEMTAAVQDVVGGRVPVSCGSGAIPRTYQERIRNADLAQNACFNLEIWSPSLFAAVCPGKNRWVGYDRWLGALEDAVNLWGRERAYSAMVAGIELEPEHGMTWREAADLALAGAEDLCARGVIPVYSLYWPVGGRDHPDYMSNLMAYFAALNVGYRAIRERYNLRIWDGFMTYRSAYMQIECDIDRALDRVETAA